MKSCVFLSCKDLTGFVHDDALAVEAFGRRGCKVQTIAWDDEDFDWSRAGHVIIRTTWDYTARPTEFMQRLRNIEAAGAKIWNPLSLVAWNLSKTYLLELEKTGVAIVPTVISPEFTDHRAALERARVLWNTNDIVVKPVIGAGGKDTFVVRRDLSELAPCKDRSLMIQPLMPRIFTDGEFSLIYFGKTLSHAICKIPKVGEFRSQEEYDSSITLITPPHAMQEASQKIISNLNALPFYSRVDFVWDEVGVPRLMEIELIEPALYFRYDETSAPRFVEHVYQNL